MLTWEDIASQPTIYFLPEWETEEQLNGWHRVPLSAPTTANSTRFCAGSIVVSTQSLPISATNAFGTRTCKVPPFKSDSWTLRVPDSAPA